MFMGKANLSNIKSLLKIRNKECTGINFIYYLMGFLFVVDLIGIIKNVFKFHSEAVGITVQPYSNWGFILAIITCIYYTVDYKYYNYRHQIFPQNSRNSFAAYTLFCYLSFLKIQAAALGLYILQYGICELFNIIKGNIDFAYRFNLFFLVSGFFVVLLYGFIIITLIILLGALDRKFTWYFRVSIIGTLVILFLTLRLGWLLDRIHLLTKEYSLALFIVKALGILVLLLLLSYGINESTRQYKLSQNYKPYYFAIIVVFFIIVSLSVNYGLQSISNGPMYETQSITQGITQDPLESVVQVDVSDIPDGGTLNIQVPKENSMYHYPFSTCTQTVYPDKILINYMQPVNKINYIDLISYSKPDLGVSLKGNVLSIRIISTENKKIIMIYPFSFLQNFDCYEDNSYYKKQIGTESASGGGVITLFLPEAKNLTIIPSQNP